MSWKRWVRTPGLLLSAALVAAPSHAVAPSPPTSVQVVERTPTSALIRWTPSVDPTKGFKVRNSDVPGLHPDPGLFPGGKLAAFTWTTDDGYDMNLVYDQIFSSRGVHFTAFLNSGTIGNAGKMTWDQVRFLYGQGHEIGNHDRDHASLIDDRAISVRYTGPEPCNVQIFGDNLRTFVDGVPDLDWTLADPTRDHLVELAALLDAEPDYEATLLYSDLEISATQSTFLDPVTIPIGAGAPAGTLTTERGVHDDAEMLYQIMDSHLTIESEIAPIDSTYRCRTFGYPNHAHRQWAMSMLNELGYAGARGGSVGAQPFYSEGSFVPGFMTTYESPLNFPRPDNSWTEAFTRQKYQSRVAAWKAAHTWAILMAHNASESDSAHVDWMLDEIAADPDVWVAPFGDVIEFLNQYYVDLRLPIDPDTGTASAWIHDLNPNAKSYVVVTAYNDALQESAWSMEVTVPAYSSGVAAPFQPSAGPAALTVAPNPFAGSTRLSFAVPTEGPVRLDVYDVRGARLEHRDLGALAAGPGSVSWSRGAGRWPAGLYFVRVSGRDWSATGRAHLVD